jgi:hypothetical protein
VEVKKMGRTHEVVIEKDLNLEKQPKPAFRIKYRVYIYMALTVIVLGGIFDYVMGKFSWMMLLSFAAGVSLCVILIVAVIEYAKRTPITYRGSFTVLMIEVASGSEPVWYKDRLFIRDGAQCREVTGQEINSVYKLFE